MDTERTTTQSQGNVPNEPNAARAQIFLSPIASPTILGMFGLAMGLFAFGTRFAAWYGNFQDFRYLFPFFLFVAGLSMFLAGMWSYKARDGVGTALFSLWGMFWFAWGILWLVEAGGLLTVPTMHNSFVPFGYWLIAMSAITWSIAAASWAEGASTGLVTIFLAAGTTILAVGILIGNSPLDKIGGWFLLVDCLLAWYAGTAVLVDQAYGFDRLPMLHLRSGAARHREETGTVSFGEPGIARGR